MKNKDIDISDIQSDIIKIVNTALLEEVAPKVIDELIEHAMEDVYSAYEPKEYKRRFSFMKKGSYYSYLAKDGELHIEPVAVFNDEPPSNNVGTGLAQLIDEGNGGGGYWYEHWGKSSNYEQYLDRSHAQYLKPRPFFSNVAEELDYTEWYLKIVENALRKNGYDVGNLKGL